VTEVVAATGLSQPNTSAHLACLGECGLVTRNRWGKFVFHGIGDKRVIAVLEEADGMLGEIGVRIARCARYQTPATRGLAAGARRRRGGRAG
jgi:DNA-binding transcriptional ArsR family regulator